VKPTLWLADYAKVSDGKIDSLGAGWSTVTAQGPIVFFAAGTIEVPWNLTNQQHTIRLDLLDADGQPVLLPDHSEVHIEGTFEVGRPPGTPVGTPMVLPFAFPFGPLELTPGRYQLRLTIADEHREDWYVAFNVAAAPPQIQAA
jgi:Family of unknown function (DUF6941)